MNSSELRTFTGVGPPIPVGYAERPAVDLPAPEADFTGKIGWYNQCGFAHDWLTGWTEASDLIWWEVDVVTAGRYDVSIQYTCPPDAVGTDLRVESAASSVGRGMSADYDPRHEQPRQFRL